MNLKMYLEEGQLQMGDVVPDATLNNIQRGIQWEDLSWYDSQWGFADPLTGKKVGSMKMALEDHRGFLGSNVYMGYNPWGFGQETSLRGVGFDPKSIITPEQMESIARSSVDGMNLIDEDGDTVNIMSAYLPFNPAINNFNMIVPLIEDDEASIPEYIRAFVDSDIGYMEDGEFQFEINRFTQKEQDLLIQLLKQTLAPRQTRYLGIDNAEPGDVRISTMYHNIINSIPEADFTLLRNNLKGNTRFSMPIEDFESLFEKWIKNDAQSNWFDREYLDDLEGNQAFLNELKRDPSAVHTDGTPLVEEKSDYKGRPVLYFDYGEYGGSSADMLDVVLNTITGKNIQGEYDRIRAAVMKSGQTPIAGGWGDSAKNGQSDLDVMQPTFSKDRFGITDRSKRYDRRMRVNISDVGKPKKYVDAGFVKVGEIGSRKKYVRPKSFRHRTYSNGRDPHSLYVADVKNTKNTQLRAQVQASMARRNGYKVRTVKTADGWLNYFGVKPSAAGKYGRKYGIFNVDPKERKDVPGTYDRRWR